MGYTHTLGMRVAGGLVFIANIIGLIGLMAFVAACNTFLEGSQPEGSNSYFIPFIWYIFPCTNIVFALLAVLASEGKLPCNVSGCAGLRCLIPFFLLLTGALVALINTILATTLVYIIGLADIIRNSGVELTDEDNTNLANADALAATTGTATFGFVAALVANLIVVVLGCLRANELKKGGAAKSVVPVAQAVEAVPVAQAV